MKRISLLLILLAPFTTDRVNAAQSVLIVDGRNNHDWAITTDALQATLKATGRFDVNVATAPQSRIPRRPYRPRRTKDKNILAEYDAALKRHKTLFQTREQEERAAWQSWSVPFKNYDAVLMNYNGPEWPEPMKEALIDYVRNGGGLVLVHASNNAFGNWQAFNDMIGLGWRKAGFGTSLKIDADTGKPIEGCGDCNSGHGSKHPFQVTVRQPDHPIMKGLPPVWMHGQDELYHNMRGPAKNVTVLSSAFSDPKTNGTGEHEPITWEVSYGKGRVIVTSMGHFWRGQTWWDSLYCAGFQTVLARSVEYAATGKVTLPIPEGFPSAEQVSLIPPHRIGWQPSPSQAKQTLKKKTENPYVMLTPEEERQTFTLAEGYVADLVAAEPDVQEPVLTVWDGNGVLYVAEMRSYMQDEKGTGTKTLKNGRIKRLEDTNGDGQLDRVTIFADKLNLPRMILPLDDRLAIRETDTTDIWSYRDTDGDGIADEKKLLHQGGSKARGNTSQSVEHQDSGLIWNIDNYIYISYNAERYRFTDGDWKAERQPGHWCQWGLDHDDAGRLFWIDNSRPLKSVQLHPKYWDIPRRWVKNGLPSPPIDLLPPHDPDFLSANSTCLLNDRGGTAGATRAFTSACGQSVFRGHKFPVESRGNYFFCDPTIHIVRQAEVENQNGFVHITRAGSEPTEFFMSSDINSRFVNTATGPDGTLYVTDMYRGII
ncbi:MAG: ThuA domain-containing protein, partial [Verrucomicrobiota bacterium]